MHTASEQIAMLKKKGQPIADCELKHQVEVELSRTADVVVGFGPLLTENIKFSLRPDGKDEHVFKLLPGISAKFSQQRQASEERALFQTLVFGRGDYEDFELKG